MRRVNFDMTNLTISYCSTNQPINLSIDHRIRRQRSCAGVPKRSVPFGGGRGKRSIIIISTGDFCPVVQHSYIALIVVLSHRAIVQSYTLPPTQLTPVGLTIFRSIHAIDRDKPNTLNSDLTYSIVVSVSLVALITLIETNEKKDARRAEFVNLISCYELPLTNDSLCPPLYVYLHLDIRPPN